MAGLIQSFGFLKSLRNSYSEVVEITLWGNGWEKNMTT